MVAASVLDGHVTVQVKGNVVAPNAPANFVVPGSPANVANYIRQGSDLIIEMKTGQTFTIQGFAQQGLVNNIVLSAGGANTLVDISAAFTAAAVSNGILAPALITIEAISASTSVMSLLGILGAAGAAGGVGLVALSVAGQTPVDTTPPAAPVLDLVSDDVGTKLGALSSGGLTDDTRPTFSGRGGIAGATIELWEGATLLGSSTVGSGGDWSVSPSTGLRDGQHGLSLVQRDTSGNGSAGTGFVVVVDSTAPGTPVLVHVVDAVDAVTGEIQPGGATDDTRPVLSGTGEAGAIVELREGNVVLGSTIVGNDGAWSVRPSNGLSEGSHNLVVVLIDAAGNKSPAAGFVVVVDTIAPEAPVIVQVTDTVDAVTGAVQSGGVINDTRPLFAGTGEAGATVELRQGNVVLATAVVGMDGRWSVSPTAALSAGTHAFTVVQSDTTGHRSPVSSAFNLTVDTGASQLVIGSVMDDVDQVTGAIVAHGTTNDTQPTLSGTGAEAGSTIELRENGSVIGTAIAGNDGAWSVSPTLGLADGAHSLTVVQIDAAGNRSQPSTAFELTVDTQYSGADPVIDPVTTDQPDNRTPGIYVGENLDPAPSLYVDGEKVASTYDPVTGMLTPVEPLSDGEHTITYTLSTSTMT
ncbi:MULTISPECIES: Ig-like domain-containing protein [Mesorhizobium]|uniref:Ig-like domain repeat protein n=1 Tax=Mesorhizobium denitrificans TaxID=2294114 RepID=A0A371X3X0_9HYPH|nr:MULTISPECIES: Ig-like domain-containing protein [Mesorhizobium]RFC63913.1 hypothetical protein DY251_20055 [Mesorhizobium denitrificans]